MSDTGGLYDAALQFRSSVCGIPAQQPPSSRNQVSGRWIEDVELLLDSHCFANPSGNAFHIDHYRISGGTVDLTVFPA